MELRWVQVITLTLSLIGVLVCLWWMRRYAHRRGYIAPVLIVFAHTTAYYAALFVTKTPTETSWSLVWGAALRLHTIATLLLYPLLMPPFKR